MVGRAHFAEAGAAGFENVRDAETAADLDQFASGDDDLLAWAGGEMAEDKDEGGGAVVDDGGGGGAGGEGDGLLEVGGTGASFAGFQVEFEIGIPAGDRAEGGEGGEGERGAAEVGMSEDAGAVDDGLKALAGAGGEGLIEIGHDRVEVGDGGRGAKRGELLAEDVDDEGSGQIGWRDCVQESVDGRDGALGGRRHGGEGKDGRIFAGAGVDSRAFPGLSRGRRRSIEAGPMPPRSRVFPLVLLAGFLVGAGLLMAYRKSGGSGEAGAVTVDLPDGSKLRLWKASFGTNHEMVVGRLPEWDRLRWQFPWAQRVLGAPTERIRGGWSGDGLCLFYSWENELGFPKPPPPWFLSTSDEHGCVMNLDSGRGESDLRGTNISHQYSHLYPRRTAHFEARVGDLRRAASTIGTSPGTKPSPLHCAGMKRPGRLRRTSSGRRNRSLVRTKPGLSTRVRSRILECSRHLKGAEPFRA